MPMQPNGPGSSIIGALSPTRAKARKSPPSVITQVAQPLNPHLGVIGVEWAPFGFPGLAICTANVPGDVAIGVENHLDDGDPRRGMIRAARQNVENEAIASADAAITSFSSDGSEKYILCQRLD